MAEEKDIEVSVPRTVKRQQHCSNTPAATPEEYWRQNVYVPFLDELLTELKDRMCIPMPRLKAQYLLPSRVPQLIDEVWDDIKQEYQMLLPDINAADAELVVWKHVCHGCIEML